MDLTPRENHLLIAAIEDVVRYARMVQRQFPAEHSEKFLAEQEVLLAKLKKHNIWVEDGLNLTLYVGGNAVAVRG